MALAWHRPAGAKTGRGNPFLATPTSKGQITLPKEIRDRLGLDAGATLDFQILADNTITARQVLPDARRIRDRRIDALLALHGSTPGALLVTDVVLAEAVWTLRSAFDQDKAAQLLALRSLLDETAFAFDDRDAVVQAVALFEQGNCGFSGCLIVARHASLGCAFTATLDGGMRKLPKVKVL